MKISELIEQLSKYPQDMKIFGYSNDPCKRCCCSGFEQISGITLSETPVFIDSLDDSVCIAYESVVEKREGDTECYSVLIAYPSKINTNDIREGCVSLDDLKSTLIISDKESA